MAKLVTYGRIASTAALLPLLACVRDYRPPALAQPHAELKVRLSYPTLPEAELEQLIMVDGDAVRDAVPALPAAKAVSSRPIPIRAGTVRVTVQSTYFHNRVTTHAETYETTQEAPCGGSTCVQTVPHTRAVNHVERIDDATCAQAVKLDAQAGESYLLEYDFEGEQRCTLRCFRKAGGKRVACQDGTGKQ